MAKTFDELKQRLIAVRDAENQWSRRKTFALPAGTEFFGNYSANGNLMVADQEIPIALSSFEPEGIKNYFGRSIRCHHKDTPERATYSYYQCLTWDMVKKNKEICKRAEAWVDKVTPQVDVVKEGGIIRFTRKETGEKLSCDLNKQTFVRSYQKGKDKQINYPMQFFKYLSGRLLIKMIEDENCKVFTELVRLVSQKYSQCRNFGTFLVRMFDHIHLEQYISAGVPFSFDTPFSYSDFDKDIRAKLNEYKMTYDASIGSLFCSDKDTGRAVFAQIKDCRGFANMVNLLAYNIQALNTLVNHYHYDLKTLFAYCRERNWHSGVRAYWDTTPTVNPETNKDRMSYYSYDIINYLRDYARQARLVFGDNYDKYPKNLKQAHDEASVLFKSRELDVTTKLSFEETIDKSLEWENKEFKIVYPKSADEVLAEGQKLRHCVGSYITSVIRGECKIVFLRSKENPDVPLVTVELQGGNIRQARGYGNSDPKYDARIALKEYAKEKKFLYVR